LAFNVDIVLTISGIVLACGVALVLVIRATFCREEKLTKQRYLQPASLQGT